MPRADWWVDHAWREKLLEQGFDVKAFEQVAYKNVFIDELFEDIRRWLIKAKCLTVLEEPSLTLANSLKASGRYREIELMVRVDEIGRYANSSDTRVFFILLSKKENTEVSDFVTQFFSYVNEAARKRSAVPRAVFKKGCVTCGRPLKVPSILCAECTERFQKHRASRYLARLSNRTKEDLRKARELEKEGKSVEAAEEYYHLAKKLVSPETSYWLSIITENVGLYDRLHHLSSIFEKKALNLRTKSNI